MLDVHPAHHAAITFRDFLIHIATSVNRTFPKMLSSPQTVENAPTHTIHARSKFPIDVL
jgi:hypothetical protein